MGNGWSKALKRGVWLGTVTPDPVYFAGVPAEVAMVRPVTCEPHVLKVPKGGSGKLRIAIRNPFDVAVSVRVGVGLASEVSAGGEKTLGIDVPQLEVAEWSGATWSIAGEGIGEVEGIPFPVRAVALEGDREAVFEMSGEIAREVTVPDNARYDATDEVTLACRYRSSGSSGTWQSPVQKWAGDERNYGIYLGREKGEFCFSADFKRGSGPHTDFNSGVGLFDGEWHHLAVTYSSHDGEVCFYVDGERVYRVGFDGGRMVPVRAPIRLGCGMVPSGGGAPVGAVRDVGIWARALAPEEILVAAGRGPSRK
jgi:hypothetical protein